jgi:hypothetical protein
MKRRFTSLDLTYPVCWQSVDTVGAGWYSIGWAGWVGVVGTTLTIVGVALAIHQGKKAATAARQAKSAAEAAEAAARSTWDHLNAIHLQAAAPHLRDVANAIERAVELGDSYWARQHLNDWRTHASRLQGLLMANGAADLAAKLNRSAALARTAGDLLLRNKNGSEASPMDMTTKARQDIHRCVDEVNVFASNTNLTTWGPENAS